MLITTYLCTDSGYYEGYNDYGEFGAGRKLVKMIKTLQVYNMTIIISRFIKRKKSQPMLFSYNLGSY